jgi:hypothetical protein
LPPEFGLEQWAQIAADYYGAKPHPQAPTLKVRDVPIAVELASHLKFGQGDGHASLKEAELFWKEFEQLGVSPQQFHELVDAAAVHSFALHGRAPSMSELKRFSDPKVSPKDIEQWYHQLPDRHYPIAAGELHQAMLKAEPHAIQHLGRKPVKKEGFLVASGVNPESYYPQASKPLTLKPQGAQGGAQG